MVALAVFTSCIALSCDTVVGPQPDDQPDVRAYVFGAALEGLDDNGHFRFTNDPQPAIQGDLIVGAVRAAELAVSYVRTYRPRGLVWDMHGGPIDWMDVASAEERPAYFAQGVYESIADSFPTAFDRAFGPQYIVPLYIAGAPVASVSVAARVTDLRIDSRGELVPSERLYDGSKFIPWGVPQNADTEFPVSPEQAVMEVVRATGSKVTEVPRLWQPRLGIAPQSARWELTLEEPITVGLLSDDRLITTRTIYVSSFPWAKDRNATVHVRVRYEVPADIQPARDTIRYILPMQPGGEPVARTAIIDFLPGSVVEFREITF
ncbi:MAG TPA: hypothetical protein VHG09_12140 [Longimicrobiales bacterium]|nr:hypothetical protein [Longimicrobiales bacterium]